MQLDSPPCNRQKLIHLFCPVNLAGICFLKVAVKQPLGMSSPIRSLRFPWPVQSRCAHVLRRKKNLKRSIAEPPHKTRSISSKPEIFRGLSSTVAGFFSKNGPVGFKRTVFFFQIKLPIQISQKNQDLSHHDPSSPLP